MKEVRRWMRTDHPLRDNRVHRDLDHRHQGYNDPRGWLQSLESKSHEAREGLDKGERWGKWSLWGWEKQKTNAFDDDDDWLELNEEWDLRIDNQNEIEKVNEIEEKFDWDEVIEIDEQSVIVGGLDKVNEI